MAASQQVGAPPTGGRIRCLWRPLTGLSRPIRQGSTLRRSTILLLATAALAAPLAVGAQAPAPPPLRPPRIIDYLPPRQPGQWEVIKTTSYDVPPTRTQLCIDPATDTDAMEIAFLLLGTCPDAKIERLGSELIIDERCDYAKLKQTSRTTIFGDFQTTITVRINITAEVTFQDAPLLTTMTRTARWLGPSCAPGFAPGDIVLPLDGKKLSVRQPGK